jgi:hypothetical protein
MMTTAINCLMAAVAGAFLYLALYTIVAVQFIMPLVIIGATASAAGFFCLAYYTWMLVHTKYIVIQNPQSQ